MYTCTKLSIMHSFIKITIKNVNIVIILVRKLSLLQNAFYRSGRLGRESQLAVNLKRIVRILRAFENVEPP